MQVQKEKNRKMNDENLLKKENSKTNKNMEKSRKSNVLKNKTNFEDWRVWVTA